MCEKQSVIVASSKVRYFLSSKSYSGTSLNQFHLKGNNGSKRITISIPKDYPMSFEANYSKKYVQKVKKYCLLDSTLSEKWHNLTWPYNSQNFNLHHPSTDVRWSY